MCRRQITTVGAEAEDPDIAIAACLETRDFLVVGNAADLDRPVEEPECVAGHGGIEGERERAPRKWNVSPGGFQIGQRQAGDRFIAQRIEPLARQLQVPGNRGRLGQRVEAVESLPHLAAEPTRARLRLQGAEELLTRVVPARSMRRLSTTARWFLSR